MPTLLGDYRDEVVVWDPQELWIYTQDDGSKEGKLYNPVGTRSIIFQIPRQLFHCPTGARPPNLGVIQSQRIPLSSRPSSHDSCFDQ